MALIAVIPLDLTQPPGTLAAEDHIAVPLTLGEVDRLAQIDTRMAALLREMTILQIERATILRAAVEDAPGQAREAGTPRRRRRRPVRPHYPRA